MIVFHPSLTEDLVEFTDFESIVARPQYCRDVDPTKVKLVKPVGIYRFRDKTACGLKTCHTPHQKGLVVLTSEGQEVNIGHICGKRHFGDSYEAFARTARRFEARKAYRSVIHQVRSVGARLLEEVDGLMNAPNGAAWCFHARKRFEKAVPYDVVRAVTEMARRGESAVHEEYEVFGEVAELHRELGIRSSVGRYARTQTVRAQLRGHLRGLDIWAQDPGHQLFELRESLDALMRLDTLECSHKVLREAADFASQVDARLSQARRLVATGQAFFSSTNLALLRYLPNLTTSSRSAMEALDLELTAGTYTNARVA